MKWINIKNEELLEEAWVTEFAWGLIQEAMSTGKSITFSTRVVSGMHPKKGKFGEVFEFVANDTPEGTWEKIGEEDL